MGIAGGAWSNSELGTVELATPTVFIVLSSALLGWIYDSHGDAD